MIQDSLQHELETLENSLTRDAFISELASQVAWRSQFPRSGDDRRGQHRSPSARLVRLTPLAENMVTPSASSIFVVEKSLAMLGFDFYHHEPITHRYVAVSFEHGSQQSTHFALKLSWCRFLHPGWYDSGGRFIRVLDDLPNIDSDDEPTEKSSDNRLKNEVCFGYAASVHGAPL